MAETTLHVRPRLLLLASKLGYQTHSFVEAARRLGVEVTIGSDRCHQLDDPWADGAVPLHFDEPEQAAERLAEAVRTTPVHAILALGDRQTATAAYAARILGLRSSSPESVNNCRSKLRQRELLRARGPARTGFLLLSRWPSRSKPFFARVSFPCVVKPLRLSASQGVIRANDAIEFRRGGGTHHQRLLDSPEVQRRIRRNSIACWSSDYIPGAEIALEGLLEQGRLRTLALFDKPDPLEGPYFEESIYVTPSRLPAEMQARILECAAHTVRALGLSEGPVHAEFRVNDAGPWVLEAAPAADWRALLAGAAVRAGSDPSRGAARPPCDGA